jgi:hypothetical protein
LPACLGATNRARDQRLAAFGHRHLHRRAPRRSRLRKPTALTALGAACYLAGVFLIVWRYAADRGWRFATDWDNSNCILHGALSTTGLTATTSGVLGLTAATLLWTYTGAVDVVVEAIELARAVARLRVSGWRDGLLVYDVSQWARNFTVGMFYAFTLAFAMSRRPMPFCTRRAW